MTHLIHLCGWASRAISLQPALDVRSDFGASVFLEEVAGPSRATSPWPTRHLRTLSGAKICGGATVYAP